MTGGAVANRRKNNTCWLLIYYWNLICKMAHIVSPLCILSDSVSVVVITSPQAPDFWPVTVIICLGRWAQQHSDSGETNSMSNVRDR